MARFSITLFLVVLLYVYTAEGSVFRESLNQVGEGGHFDKLALVVTWPPTFCIKKNKCVQTINGVKSWTIHGLWPVTSGVHATDTPIDCGETFDPELFPGPLLNEMKQKWPNLIGSNDVLWKSEFEKHGMCPSDPSVFRPQVQYFQDAITLYNTYDIEQILRDGRVVPSTKDVYQWTQVKKALYEGLGALPKVYCHQPAEKSIQYLYEVRMCFELNFRPINCGKAIPGGGTCNHNKPIKYLPTETKVNHQILNESGDLAVQFLVDIAEMDARDKMMDEE